MIPQQETFQEHQALAGREQGAEMVAQVLRVLREATERQEVSPMLVVSLDIRLVEK
jgi:hypothetical protein